MTKKILNVHLIAIATFIISSCGMSPEDEKVELYKCTQSAMYLSRNEDLMRKAADWKSKALPQNIETRDDHMRLISKYNYAMSEVMNGNGNLDRSLLQDWYNSNYCKSVLSDYQDYELGAKTEREAEIVAKNKEEDEALLRQVSYFSKSMADENTSEVSCDKFKEQFDITYNNPTASKYKNDLESGLRKTIKASLFKLKKFQTTCIESQITNNQIEQLSKQLYENCPSQKLLSNQVELIDSVRLCESKRSSLIREKLNQLKNDNDCGDIPEAFCLADLHRAAAKNAYLISKNCDLEDNIPESCYLDGEQLYISELTKVELDVLNKEKLKHERYIEKPEGSGLFNSGNAQSNIYLLAEKCKGSAISQGLRGDAYQRYSKEVCEPNAKNEFLKPQIDVLKKIARRLEEVNKETSHAEKSTHVATDQSLVASNSDKFLEGIIKEYACGDSCYLTIIDIAGQERSGLCSAPLCKQWNAESGMPVEYKVKKVRITIRKGFQNDGNGNVMGETDAFDQIELVESNTTSTTATTTDAQWSEGFGQGNLEYFIDKDGIRLYIACPTQDGSPEAQSGVSLYQLSNDANFGKFAIDANGHSYDGPFSADSRVGDNNFLSLLEDLRKSDAVVKFNGKAITFPKSNAANVLPVHGEKFSCNLFF